MEEFLKIQNGKYIIYGTLNSSSNKKLIIFVHGLSGNQHEHQYFNAVPFFNKKGFDTFRFDFYPKAKDARVSSESSISTHTEDINAIIKHFNDKYEDISIIGHSVGCLAMMNADLSTLKKIIYWDPTSGFKDLKDKNISYDEDKGKYILHWGYESIISKEMVDEWKEAYDLAQYSKRLSGDYSFIFAGNAEKYETWKPYISGHDYAIIEGASHRFIEEGTLEKLYQATFEMLE